MRTKQCAYTGIVLVLIKASWTEIQLQHLALVAYRDAPGPYEWATVERGEIHLELGHLRAVLPAQQQGVGDLQQSCCTARLLNRSPS